MPTIERLSAGDATALASDVGPAPMQVGAVLELRGGQVELEDVRRRIAERLGALPRLGQRLMHPPFGCGFPYWVDDTDFEIAEHVFEYPDTPPADDSAMLDLAAQIVATRLASDRPLWSATLVPAAQTRATSLVVVFHHVLADGIGGLAILASLVDGAQAPPTGAPRRSVPTTRELLVDAMAARGRALARLPMLVQRLRDAISALRSGTSGRVAPSSLNRPTGPGRSLTAVRCDLESVRSTAHRSGGTVNDAVLACVTGALRTLLRSRGEDRERFVVSVPVSARVETTGENLGNEVGAVPLDLSAGGSVTERLREIADVTREAKRAPRAASTAILGPLFRFLSRVGLFGVFVNRQRLVHTFVTNVRGPSAELSFLGARVSAVTPVAVTPGNVTVSFAVLSYAGTLTIAIISDPETCPDVDVLAEAVASELAALDESAQRTETV